MKVVLVTCFNAQWNWGRVLSPYIPLNLLNLGTSLQNSGHEVEIVDQTLALLQGKVGDGARFQRDVAELIYAAQPDVVGLTTMCNTYPSTLSLARHCREIDPHARIILGGPQATVTDVHTLEHFAWIDLVVRGEADNTLSELINCWENGGCLEHLAGITWRGEDGQIHRNDDAPLLQDLDALPFLAYDLYPMDQVISAAFPIEAGRGCPYGCIFCSTSRFFKRRYRIKSAQRLIAEMKYVYENYGFTSFELTHDNLAVNRQWMREFCHGLINSGHSFEWGSGVRVDNVDADLLSDMARAGCKQLFFGIETGSQRLQPVIKKNLKLVNALPTIQTCVEHGIKLTASFITGFPDETMVNMLDTFNMALDIFDMAPGHSVQLHLLAPLTGSQLHEQYKGRLQFDGHSSDISLFMLTDAEFDLVRRHPEIFPSFYYIPTPKMDRDVSKAASAVLYSYPGLFVALRRAGLSMEDVLNGWIAWRRKHVAKDELDQGYYLYRFGLDMCRYLRTEVVNSALATAPFLGDLVDCAKVKYALRKGHQSEQTVFCQFEYDVLQLNEMLRARTVWPAVVEPVPTDVLFINLAFNPDRGFIYLEVKLPHSSDPLVRPGDELEVRDPVKQLQTRPNLIIRNNTQKKVFTTKHHMTERKLRALGLPVAA